MLNIIINDILSIPALLIGFFVLLGNILLKKSIPEIISGTFQTIIGFTMLGLGADIVSGTLDNFSQMFTKAFDLQAVIMNTDAYGALLNEKFKITPIIMVLGMLINLIIAKFSKYKYIFLSGNIILYMSGILAMSLNKFHPIISIVLGSTILGIYMSISPAIINKYTVQITHTDDFGIANSGSISYFISAKIGEKIGDKNESIEDLSFPKSLNFLKDPAISMSVTMSFLFVFVSLFSGIEYIEQTLSNGQNFIIFSFMQGIIFASGVLILLKGIKMSIDQLVPAFRGIADNMIEGAIPGLDAPIIATYAPNAMIFGFIISLMTSLIGMSIISIIGLPIIIPGMLQHFFLGGVSAAYGNSTGGRKGAFAGAVINGIMLSSFPSLFLSIMGTEISETIIIGDSDFTVIGILIKSLVDLF